MSRFFNNTQVAYLTAEEYQREAEQLLPLQKAQMRAMFLGGIAASIRTAEAEIAENTQTSALGPVNEGTRLYPVRNWWWYLGKEREMPPSFYDSDYKIPDRAYFIYRRDTTFARGALRTFKERLYPIGCVTDGGEEFILPEFSIDQLRLVKDCCDKLIKTAKENELLTPCELTGEVACSIIDPPLDWKPLDWN